MQLALPSLEAAEKVFRREHHHYADTAVLDELRSTEYARLDAGGHVYLDYTGGGMYARSQLREHFGLLQGGVFGNPHSINPTSAASTALVERARASVFEFFHAASDEYLAIFTANATGALRLVGEAYPFRAGDRFLLTLTTTTRSTAFGSSPARAAPRRPTYPAWPETCASTRSFCRAT